MIQPMRLLCHHLVAAMLMQDYQMQTTVTRHAMEDIEEQSFASALGLQWHWCYCNKRRQASIQSKTKMMIFQINWRSSIRVHWLRIIHPFLGEYQTLGFTFCLFQGKKHQYLFSLLLSLLSFFNMCASHVSDPSISFDALEVLEVFMLSQVGLRLLDNFGFLSTCILFF